jgi:RNA polymerase sigma-70 factor (ECF subfamily)
LKAGFAATAEGSRIERDLVIRARQGDLDAFSDLTSGRASRLFRVARLILRDDAAAEDAVQDALIRAWQDLRGLRDPDRFDAWLHRLLVRACYRAAERHRRFITVEIDVDREAGARGADPQGPVAVQDQLERGFRRLSADQRAVIVLHHYLGLSLADAADALGMPIGTMKSRLSRATQVMRAAIEADDRTPTLAGQVLR